MTCSTGLRGWAMIFSALKSTTLPPIQSGRGAGSVRRTRQKYGDEIPSAYLKRPRKNQGRAKGEHGPRREHAGHGPGMAGHPSDHAHLVGLYWRRCPPPNPRATLISMASGLPKKRPATYSDLLALPEN